MTDKTEEIKRLEDEIKQAKEKQAAQRAALESPFTVVGNAIAEQPKRRGRPPGTPNKPKDDTLATESLNGDEARKVAHSQRMSEINRPPPNSSSESVRDWAEKEIHNLLPEAVASLAWDIKYGDGRARTEARGEILRATGIDKKDAANFGKGGQIVINVGPNSGGITLPYLQRTEPSPSSPVIQTLTTKKDES